VENQAVSLSEKDYLDILSLIETFNACQTRSQLKKIFNSHLLPQFEAQAMLYAWIDPTWKEHQLMDTLGISEKDQKPLQEFLTVDPLPQKIFQNFRSVVSYDTDLSRNVVKNKIDKFLKDNPQFKPAKNSWFAKFRTSLITVDLPNPTVGLGLHRMIPHDKPWDLKDLRKLELLRPHLLHTIKTIFLSEELNNYKSMVEEVLGNSSTAIALVKANAQIIYHNKIFDEIFSISTGVKKLPDELSSLINRELSRYESPYDIEDAKLELPFYRYGEQVFHLELILLKGKGYAEDRTLFVRLTSSAKPYSRLNLLMQDAGLTGREMEICILVKSGIDNQNITDRLFISLHTVKNHIKSIHKKLSVNTRPQLVALLNQPR
jgi:DNA-binding CsgD family transcriptional regulator